MRRRLWTRWHRIGARRRASNGAALPPTRGSGEQRRTRLPHRRAVNGRSDVWSWQRPQQSGSGRRNRCTCSGWRCACAYPSLVLSLKHHVPILHKININGSVCCTTVAYCVTLASLCRGSPSLIHACVRCYNCQESRYNLTGMPKHRTSAVTVTAPRSLRLFTGWLVKKNKRRGVATAQHVLILPVTRRTPLL